MVPSFTALLDELPTSYGVFMHVSIYYTRSSPVSGMSSSGSELSQPSSSRITISPGRPAIPESLEELARSATAIHNPRGVAVGVCGPEELIHDVEQCALRLDSGLRRSCGGVELDDEYVIPYSSVMNCLSLLLFVCFFFLKGFSDGKNCSEYWCFSDERS